MDSIRSLVFIPPTEEQLPAAPAQSLGKWLAEKIGKGRGLIRESLVTGRRRTVHPARMRRASLPS